VRRPLLLLGLGLSALVVQGALAVHAPRGALPNLAFLVVLALGVTLPGAAGLCVAAALGYAADLLSGAPPGLHALLFLGAFGLARLASARIDLRRGLPFAVAAVALTVAAAFAFAALAPLFGRRGGLHAALFATLAWQLPVHALAAPLVLAAARALAALGSPEELGRRPVRIEPRRPLL
jgi:cell shape-determining protein MreD